MIFHWLGEILDNGIILIFLLVSALLPAPIINGLSYRQSLGIEWTGLAISYGIAKRFHWTVGLCVFWVIFECFINPNSFVSLISLLFIVCGALFLTESIVSYLLVSLGLISIIDSIVMIWRYFSTMDPYNAWLVMAAPALDAAFVALMIPVVFGIKKPEALRNVLLFFMVLAILVSRSNTAIFCNVVMFAAYLLASGKLGKKYIAAIIGMLAGASALLFKFGKLLSDQGRIQNWKSMMSYWAKNINILLGAGPGQYHHYAAKLQPSDHQFVFMHNDLLQITFDQGLIGAGSVLLLYFTMLKKSFNRPFLFSTVVGFGFISMTLFPTYLFFFQLLGVLLIYKCFERGETCQNLA